MSSLTRQKPSFIIYRDEPVDSAPATPKVPAAPVVAQRTRRPTISTTSLSYNDKENASLLPQSATTDKGKGKPKLTRSATMPVGSQSAPTSPLGKSATMDGEAIRRALSTKFVAPPEKKSKPKSSSTLQSRRTTSTSSSSTDRTSTVKRSRSVSRSTTSTSEKKRKAQLEPVVEEDPHACGPDGLTMADRRARDLTILPLGDISAAFDTGSTAPESFAAVPAPTLSRKRSRANSIVTRDTEPPLAVASSPARPSVSRLEIPSQGDGGNVTAAPSQASPHKRVRLSPRIESAPLPALQLAPTQATLTDNSVEASTREPTLIPLPSSP